MVQRNSAFAKAGAAAEPAPEATDAVAQAEERRRAAAYLDLWERQLRHVASQGAGGPHAGPPARRTGS